MLQSGKDRWQAGGPGMHGASPSHTTAGFLTRGQAPSSDSQASINLVRERGEGTGCVPPDVLRVN